MKRKCSVAAVLLINAVSSASAQTYWSYGDNALRARGYDGTPYDGGPQYGSGGGINTAMAPPTVTPARRPAGPATTRGGAQLDNS